MDCSKTEVFFKEWRRMCDKFPQERNDRCPMRMKGFTSFCCDCRSRAYGRPKEAIRIVQEWSDAHPPRTRLSVLKEKFPNVQLEEDGLPVEICAGILYGFTCEEGDECDVCWRTPIE